MVGMKDFKDFRQMLGSKLTFKEDIYSEGRKVSVKDIIKAIKKDKSRSPGALLLVYHNGREKHVAVDMDTFSDKTASSYFGTDDDGNEIEFEIKDVSRIA